ncbi:hypothetical protein [Ferruginibacter sp.]|nr:hypothetical protein [Ferruginibacter sp.]
MQKNSLFIIVLLIIPFAVSAQFTLPKTKPHPVTDSVATAMCGCIMSNKDSLVTLNSFYAVLDICLKKNSANSIQDLLKEDGFTQTDDRKTRAEAIRAIGRKLGKKVADECGGLKEIIANLTAKENKKVAAD